MRISINGKNTFVSDSLRAIIEKKLGRLDKYFPDDTPVDVTLNVEGYRNIMEVTVALDGAILRAEVTENDMYTCVDSVLDKLERQIRRHRTRLSRRIRQDAFAETPEREGDFDEDAEDRPQIVRTKRFAIKPMDPEEAAMQMDLIGHTFFVFLNAETMQVSVIYRRNDGNYGLIDPEYV